MKVGLLDVAQVGIRAGWIGRQMVFAEHGEDQVSHQLAIGIRRTSQSRPTHMKGQNARIKTTRQNPKMTSTIAEGDSAVLIFTI